MNISNIKTVYGSLLIRVFGLSGRFILLLALAKYFSIEIVGYYGIFTVTIMYSLFLVGADFYTYTTRILLESNNHEWTFIIKNQFAFYCFSYLVVSLFTLPLFYYNIIRWEWLVWFYVLLFFENFTQEVYRLLIAIDLPLKGHIIAFFRMGVWVYPLLIYWTLSNNPMNIKDVFLFWIFGNVIASFCGIYWIVKLPWFDWKNSTINLKWIFNGVNIAKKFFLNTLIWRAIFTLDRYLLLYFTNPGIVGIYTFYSGFSSTLLTLVETTVTSQLYPNLVKNYQQNLPLKKEIAGEMDKKTKEYSFWFSLFILVGTLITVFVMNKNQYINQWYILFALLFANYLLALGFVPHYILYALKKDDEILKISIQGFFIFIFLGIFLCYLMQLIGLLLCLLVTFGFILLKRNKSVVNLT